MRRASFVAVAIAASKSIHSSIDIEIDRDRDIDIVIERNIDIHSLITHRSHCCFNYGR